MSNDKEQIVKAGFLGVGAVVLTSMAKRALRGNVFSVFGLAAAGYFLNEKGKDAFTGENTLSNNVSHYAANIARGINVAADEATKRILRDK